MILYFSATGNCKYVAESIAKAFNDKACSIVDCQTDITLGQGELLGVVTPVNWYELPILTREFLTKLQLQTSGDNYTFLVVTYGTSPGCCGADAKRILKKRHISLDAAFSIRMPDNWTPIFDLSNAEKVAEQNRRAEEYLRDVIESIQARKPGDRTQRRAPYFVRYFLHPLLNQRRMTKYFYVEDGCNGCGLCAKKCPVKAIEIKAEGPAWIKERCALCLGCLHRCPQFAIQYGNGKTKRHGQYQHPKTTV